MKKNNTKTDGRMTSAQTRDFDAEIKWAAIIFLVLFVLCIGEPDIIDAIIHRLMK